MFKKVLFISLVLVGMLFCQMAGECFADASAQLEQAKAYDKNEKYEQAEVIYKTIIAASPGTDDALEAQKELTILYIAWGKQSQAEAAYEKLLAEFSGNEGIAQAVCHIADKYRRSKKDEKAREVYQYVVDNWPGSEEAMDAQARLAISNIRLGDEGAAQAAIEKLLTEFSENKRLSRGFYKIAKAYCKRGKYEKASELYQRELYQKARELYQYVLDNWPDSEEAVDAQARLAISNIRLGDENAAQAAIEKFLTEFSENKCLPEGVYRIAKEYGGLGKYEKARKFYRYVVDNWPDSRNAMDVQAGLAISYIGLGDDSNAQAAIDKLLTEFSGNENITEAVCEIAEQCCKSDKYEKARELYQYVFSNWPDSEEAVDTQTGLAISYIGLGDDPKAQAAIDSLILIADFKDHPDLARTLFLIGEEYYNKAFEMKKEGLEAQARDRFTKAITIWERIMELPQPKSIITARAYYFSANCYRQLREYQNAIAYYQNVVDNRPDYEYAWDALFRIGRNYENLGKSGVISKSEADMKIKAAYEQLLERYPACPAAKAAQSWLEEN